MSRTVIIYLAVVLVGFIACASADETCTTPSGTHGNCVVHYKCPKILSAAKDLPKIQKFEYLNKFRCGFEGVSVKLCCENKTVFANRGSAIDKQSPSSHMKDDETSCTTPNGKHGDCININKCKHDNVVSALNAVSTVNAYSALDRETEEQSRAYLNSLFCGWEETTPKICCENDKVVSNRGSSFDEHSKAPNSKGVVNYNRKKSPCRNTD